MSGGEQQMCAIGRALMARPKLLLLDEPSLGLAPIFVERIFEIIEQINKQGTSILLVEQNALMALDAADRGYVLETGRVVLADDAEGAEGRTSRSARRTSARPRPGRTDSSSSRARRRSGDACTARREAARSACASGPVVARVKRSDARWRIRHAEASVVATRRRRRVGTPTFADRLVAAPEGDVRHQQVDELGLVAERRARGRDVGARRSSLTTTPWSSSSMSCEALSIHIRSPSLPACGSEAGVVPHPAARTTATPQDEQRAGHAASSLRPAGRSSHSSARDNAPASYAGRISVSVCGTSGKYGGESRKPIRSAPAPRAIASAAPRLATGTKPSCRAAAGVAAAGDEHRAERGSRPRRTRSTRRTAGAGGRRGRRGTRRAPAASAPAARSASRSASRVARVAAVGEERAVRRLRRRREAAQRGRGAGSPSRPARTGDASRQSRSARPSPRYAAETGFGRSRGRNGVVGGMPITIASSGSASARALERGRAQQRLGVRRRRRPAEDRGGGRARAARARSRATRTPAGRSPSPSRSRERATRSSDLLRVRVAAEHARQVERERDAGHRHARREQPLELDARAASPATRSSRAATTAPAARSAWRPQALRSADGPAVQHGLGRGHGDDEVGLDERAVDRERACSRAAPSSTRSSASASWTTTLPRKRRRNSGATRSPISRGAGAPAEAAGDEDRHARDAEPLELVGGRGDRVLPRVGGRRTGSAATAARSRASPCRRGARAARAARPASGNRSASRTAAPTSSIASPGARRPQHDAVRRGRRRPRAREPLSSGTRVTRRVRARRGGVAPSATKIAAGDEPADAAARARCARSWPARAAASERVRAVRDDRERDEASAEDRGLAARPSRGPGRRTAAGRRGRRAPSSG